MEKINTQEANVRIAWSVEDISGDVKDDARYVKSFVYLNAHNADGSHSKRVLPHYTCGDSDFEDYYPIRDEDREKFD